MMTTNLSFLKAIAANTVAARHILHGAVAL